MSLNWNYAKPSCCAKWLVLPTVYSDALSYGEQLDKFCYQLNELIANNNILPDFISEMIKEYINSGAIGEVVRDILADYILNVKYPPKGITPAVGDGSADDTAAIQGCIDYAAENGGVVYLPYGSYLTQPLTMKDGVSLFGFDRYSTKIVLKGGATKPLVGGTVADFSIANLTLDGNSGIQVNDVNVVTLMATNVLFTNMIIKDGYTLLNYAGTGGHFQISNVVFGNAVEKCLLTTGNADVQCENVVFNQLSAVGGISVMDIGTDGGFFSVKSVATCNQCIVVSGNNNKISAIVENADIPVVDNGLHNNIEIFGISNKEFYSDDTTKDVNGSYSKHVGGAYTKAIDGDASESVDGNFSSIVTGISNETFNGNRTVTETNKTINTNGVKTETVTGKVTENYNSDKTETVTGKATENYNNDKTETVAGKVTENYKGDAEENVIGNKKINATDITLNPTNPLGYKEPQNLNEYFKYVQFKNGENIYNVLVGTDKTNKLNHSPFVNVQDFGAVGDGVTDDSGAFQSAVDTGYDVFIPLNKGQKYLINNTVTISKNCQRLFSLPIAPEFYTRENSMIIIKADIGFECTDYFNCFENLIFVEDQNPDSNDNKKRTAIYCSASDIVSWNIGGGECTITGCVFDRFLNAIHTNGRGYKIYQNEFAHCGTAILSDYTSTQGEGVQSPLYGFRSMTIYKNRLHGDINSTFFNLKSGILRGAELSDNKIDVSGNLLLISKGAGMCESQIKGNYCYGYCNFITIKSTIEQAFLNNILAENTLVNDFVNPGTRDGINAVGGSPFKGNIINSNVFVNYASPILFVDSLENCVICGNIIIDYNNTAPIFRTYGKPSSVVVVGNYAKCLQECVLFGGVTTYQINNSTIFANNSNTNKLTNYTAGTNTYIQDRS